MSKTTKSNQDNPVKVAIANYLQKRASEDEQFATSFSKENKSIDECFDYIIGEVRKMGTAVYLTDDEVFGMAVHYYDEDEIKVSPIPKGEGVSTVLQQAEAQTSVKPDGLSDNKHKPYAQLQNDPRQLSLFDYLEA